MKLDFKVYELKKDSKQYPIIIEKFNQPNEFIIVGEDNDWYKVQQIGENGITMIDGLKIDEFCMIVPKEDLELKTENFGVLIQEWDIPKEYLTMTTIENIQRLNE
jgi:hypothetical protein